MNDEDIQMEVLKMIKNTDAISDVISDMRNIANSRGVVTSDVLNVFADRMENAICHMRVVASAYTPILFTDFGRVHAYIEKKMDRPVWTHEFADSAFVEKVRDATREDFMKFCVG